MAPGTTPEPPRGGGYGKTISTDNLTVIEHFDSFQQLGWVEGWVKSDPQSKFFIYFLKPTAAEIKADPIFEQLIPRYRSVNNFGEFANPLQNLTFAGTLFRSVPPLAADIIVQGRCGNAEVNVESMIYLLPEDKFNAALTVKDFVSMDLQNEENATWAIGSTYNTKPEVRIGDRLTVNAPNSSNTGNIALGSNTVALVGNAITHSGLCVNPIDIGFQQNVGSAKALKDGFPDMNASDFPPEDAGGESDELELESGAYVFVIDKNIFGMETLNIFHYRCGDPTADFQINEHWNLAFMNRLKDAIEVQTDGDGHIVGYNIKKKIKIKKGHNPLANSLLADLWEALFGHKNDMFERYTADIKFITDTPYTPYMSFNGKNAFDNQEGKIEIDTVLQGDGGIYCNNSIKICGVGPQKTKEALNIVSYSGDVTINRKFIKDYRVTKSVSEPDGSGGFKTSYYTTDEHMDRVYGIFNQAEVPTDPGEQARQNAAQYIAQAILDNWHRNGEDTPYYFKLDEGTYTDIADTKVQFNDMGKPLSEKATLYELLKGSYKMEKAEVDSYIKQIVDMNSSTYYGYYKLDETNLNVLKKIAINDTGKHKVGEGETIRIKGLIYAGKSLNVDLGKDCLTVQGEVIANSVNAKSGNLNTLFDPTSLRILYNQGNCTIKESYKSTLRD